MKLSRIIGRLRQDLYYNTDLKEPTWANVGDYVFSRDKKICKIINKVPGAAFYIINSNYNYFRNMPAECFTKE